GADPGIARELPSPVHRHEDLTRLHVVGHLDADEYAGGVRLQLCDPGMLNAVALGIRRVNLDERLEPMPREPGRAAGSRHGVPLIAHAPGVEDERIALVRHTFRRSRRCRHELSLAALRE